MADLRRAIEMVAENIFGFYLYIDIILINIYYKEALKMYTAKTGKRSSALEFVHHLVASSKKKTATATTSGEGNFSKDQASESISQVHAQTLLPESAVDSPSEALQAPTDSPVTTSHEHQSRY